MFIEKQCGLRFEGYLNRQRERIDGGSDTRPEVAEFGFNTKTAYHALLLGVRTGRFSRDEVLEDLDERTTVLQRVTDKSDLPEHADFDRISAWVATMYQRWWDATVD